jgi:hypothetical protein
LISNDQALQRGIIEVQLASAPQSLDRSDKNQICCALSRNSARPAKAK